MSSKRARELLTSEQRLEFTSIPEQISEYKLGSYYTLPPHDIEIIKRHRRDHNKLGFALQLCLLGFPGWTLSDVQYIPDCVVNYRKNTQGQRLTNWALSLCKKVFSNLQTTILILLKIDIEKL